MDWIPAEEVAAGMEIWECDDAYIMSVRYVSEPDNDGLVNIRGVVTINVDQRSLQVGEPACTRVYRQYCVVRFTEAEFRFASVVLADHFTLDRGDLDGAFTILDGL